MELTIRTIMVLILILAAGLVFATMILGWGADASSWVAITTEPLMEMLFPK